MSELPEKTGEIRDEAGRFKPGISGNPAGRPKGSLSVVDAIRAKLQECPEGKEKTYLHYLVEKIMKKAIVDDDVSMIKDIINRVDGMPKQSTDITTNGKELNVNIVQYGDNNSKQVSTEGVSDTDI